MHTAKQLSQIALGNQKADLVLKNCQIINVFTHEIEKGDIAIADGIIVGIGQYEGLVEKDVQGQFVSPGFIDGHVHVESSLLTPSEYSKLVIPKGTTTIIADAHEIGNVKGIKGVGFMWKSAQDTPLKVHFMIPSCVPATTFETAGATIDAHDIYFVKKREGILGLGELMDYPSVINGEKHIMDKLSSIKGKIIDGHAPNVTDKELNAYLIRNVKTDHECTDIDEMNEKVRKGMYIHLREGSATKNVEALSKGVTNYNSHRLMFCTDDKHATDIVNEGHINYNIEKAIKHGVDPITAIQMATINTANCYKLDFTGGIAPGFVADLVIFNDINHIKPSMTIIDGDIVYEENALLFTTSKTEDESVLDSIKLNISDIDLRLPLKSNLVRVIQLIENNVTTKEVHRNVQIENGLYVNNKADDILKIAVIERHHYTKNVGLGLLEGYGLKNGAIATSIAHDSHNIICVGDNDEDMIIAVKKLKDIQGGIVVVSRGKVINYLPLEIAGLMTNEDYKLVETTLHKMKEQARELGINQAVDDPFMTIAFMALPVIPDIKITDKGLFDVTTFNMVPLEVE